MTYVIVELSGKVDTSWIPEYSTEEEARAELHDWVADGELPEGLYVVAHKVEKE